VYGDLDRVIWKSFTENNAHTLSGLYFATYIFAKNIDKYIEKRLAKMLEKKSSK